MNSFKIDCAEDNIVCRPKQDVLAIEAKAIHPNQLFVPLRCSFRLPHAASSLGCMRGADLERAIEIFCTPRIKEDSDQRAVRLRRATIDSSRFRGTGAAIVRLTFASSAM